MKNIKMEWNNDGSILAIAGTQVAQTKDGEQKQISTIQFWTPYGEVISLILTLIVSSLCQSSRFKDILYILGEYRPSLSNRSGAIRIFCQYQTGL